MSGNLSSFLIKIGVLGAKNSEKQIKGVNASLGNLAKKAATAAGAYFGTKMLLDGVKQSILAFGQQEQAEKKLRFAAGEMTDALIAQAQALQQNTRFGDEQIIAQQSYLASLGLTQQQIEDTISASLDLAAATGMSLESAVMNTSKTLSGMAGELGEKLGPGFREITQEALKAGEGIKFIAEQFGGTAQADAKSFNGQLDQMKNAVGDASEALGKSLAPIVTKIAKGLKSAAEAFQTFMRATTETGLERAIRELKEMGGETKDLELALNKIKQEDAMAQLGESSKALGFELTELVDINDQIAIKEFELIDLARQRGDLQLEITKHTNDEMSIQDLLNQKIANFTGTQYDAEIIRLQQLVHEQEEQQKIQEQKEAQLEILKDEKKAHQDINKLKLEEKTLNTEIHEDKQKATDKEENKLTKKEQKLAGLIAGNLEKQTANILKSSTVKKGSAIQEGTENAYTMAQNAYKAFADIKIVGPILGALAASAAFALGMSQVQGIRSAQYGADFVTDGPQMMMVGEGSGPERVQVTPLADPNLEGPQGGGGVTLNISGNVLHESFVEDEIIPQIREGLRMGENMGI